jgi:glycerol kinase
LNLSQYILAIDQGTTGSTAILINNKGEWVGSKDQDFPQIYPQPAWVEHDPNVIWHSVKATVEKLLNEVNVDPSMIKAIGITNQRETVVAWSRKTHKALYNALVWQCRRTTAYCEQLKKQKKQKMIQSKTGLVIDPYFSASKIRWLLKNAPEVKRAHAEKDLAVGTIDSFLLWHLTHGLSHKTDVSNASRTQIFNIKTLSWDKELLKLFSIPREILPEVQASSGIFGYTKGLGFLPDGIPISGIAGDQQAALFGQACFSDGDAKCTFGTGSFMLMNTGGKRITSKKGMLTTIAWQIQGEKVKYALEGGAFICGASVQWLRDGLGLIKKTSDIEGLAGSVESSEGVEFVPALTGLGAPYWRADARGLICGLTRGSTAAHIARATLEAMALQNAEILFAMQKDLGKKMKSLKVDGGATANNLLMQIQADYLGTKVIRPKIIETTSLGAALLAGLGAGIWKSHKELNSLWKEDRVFQSKISRKLQVERWQRWQKAIARTTL